MSISLDNLQRKYFSLNWDFYSLLRKFSHKKWPFYDWENALCLLYITCSAKFSIDLERQGSQFLTICFIYRGCFNKDETVNDFSSIAFKWTVLIKKREALNLVRNKTLAHLKFYSRSVRIFKVL